MHLYTCPTGPRRCDFYAAVTTPAAAYTLQQQLLQAYHEVLYTWWEPDTLYHACFGDFATKPTKNGHAPTASTMAKRLQAVEDRVGYEVPELLERMSPHELTEAHHVFCSQTLVGFIAHVLELERTIQHRLADGDCRTRLNDDSHAKAAGLWKSYARPERPTPPTPAPARPVPPPVLRSASRRKRRYNPHNAQQLWIWPPVSA